jgi:hypothetical protein
MGGTKCLKYTFGRVIKIVGVKFEESLVRLFSPMIFITMKHIQKQSFPVVMKAKIVEL